MRKRKSGPRTKSGRLSKSAAVLRDNGTPELQIKRKILVGGERADPSLSATMPGILFARGHLDLEQYTRAMEYRRLRCALLGPPWPSNAIGSEASEIRLAALQARFDRMCEALTLLQKEVVSNVCVYDQPPMWFCRQARGDRMRVIDEFERRALIEGLNALGSSERRRPEYTRILQSLAISV